MPNTPSLSRIADQAKLEAEIAQRIRVDSGYFGGQLPLSLDDRVGWICRGIDGVGVDRRRLTSRLMELLPSACPRTMRWIYLGRNGP